MTNPAARLVAGGGGGAVADSLQSVHVDMGKFNEKLLLFLKDGSKPGLKYKSEL